MISVVVNWFTLFLDWFRLRLGSLKTVLTCFNFGDVLGSFQVEIYCDQLF